jgi:predicted negative regulator of RcsB-dependent stress response
MATAATNKTSLAFQHLSKTLNAKPPKALDELPTKDLQDLTDKVEAALVEHEAAMAQAENSIVDQAPRALRGTVRKLLGVKS